PAAHIKLILGAMTGEPDVRPLSRTYTPRHFDAQRLELTVDFVLHGEGPASTWAAQAAPGQPMIIAGPGRSYALDPQAQWLLVAGDESAIPAVATILEALPDGVQTQVLLEVNDAADEYPIAPARAAVSLRWLHRTQPLGHAGAARTGIELAAAITAWTQPAGSGRIYVACEADAMRGIRRHLLLERGLPREWVTTRGYWKQDATDYPDRDYGEDVG
ncbi:MAG TPA: siderophore-interacting protein, partial [Steroidobacteraceae bacterium]|nr:siderophore-interacting protein [Steroidobacteraceae bacterium]